MTGPAAGSPSLAGSARATLVRYTRASVGGVLLLSAALLVALPPEGVVAAGRAGALACLVPGFAVLVWPPRGLQDGPAPPSAAWWSTACAAAAFVGVAAVEHGSGLRGPWAVQLLLALATVVAVGVAAPAWAAIGAGGLMALVLSAELLGGAARDTLRSTPLMAAARVVELVLVSIVVAVAASLLRRAAAQADDDAAALDAIEAEQRGGDAAAAEAAEWQRILHDTALNTLEAVARHGDHLESGAVAERCHVDIAVLDDWLAARPSLQRPAATLAERLQQAGTRASHLGVAVDVDLDVRADARLVPTDVCEAVAGAVGEALLNVAKHAGVANARVSAAVGADDVVVVVSDAGVGAVGAPSAADGGYGWEQSLVARLGAVGATALREFPREGGTRVTIRWRATSTPASRAPDDVLDLGRIVAWAGLAAGVVSAGVLLLGGPSFTRPGAAIVGWLLPLAWLLWLLHHRPAVPSGGEIAAACAVYAGSMLVAVGADPFCVSVIGETTVLDARVPMIVAVVLWRPTVPALAAVIGTVVCSHLFAASRWRAAWPSCGAVTAGLAAAVILLVILAWLLQRALMREQSRWQDVRERLLEAAAQLRRAEIVAAERERWSRAALAGVVALLHDVVASARRAGPGPGLGRVLRDRCAQQAAFLRALIGLGPGITGLPAALRAFVSASADAGGTVLVRGHAAALRPPEPAMASIVEVLGHVSGSDHWVLLAWSDGDEQGLMLTGRPGALATVGSSLTSGPGWRYEADDVGESSSSDTDRGVGASEGDATAAWAWSV